MTADNDQNVRQTLAFPGEEPHRQKSTGQNRGLWESRHAKSPTKVQLTMAETLSNEVHGGPTRAHRNESESKTSAWGAQTNQTGHGRELDFSCPSNVTMAE